MLLVIHPWLRLPLEEIKLIVSQLARQLCTRPSTAIRYCLRQQINMLQVKVDIVHLAGGRAASLCPATVADELSKLISKA